MNEVGPTVPEASVASVAPFAPIAPTAPAASVASAAGVAPAAPSALASAGSIAAGSSFYWAMRLMAPVQRAAMFQIYAFCRAVDDVADGPGSREQRRVALEAWRHAIEACYSGDGPVELAPLVREIRAFELAREDFLAVIDGMQMDVDHDIRAPNWATLDLFCDRVASAVGRLCVRVFGIQGEAGVALAHHLGRALQLTNILRDLDEDASVGRLYLPREALAAAGIVSDEPEVVLASRVLDRACREVERSARQHLTTATGLMDGLPRRQVRAPRIMGAAYELILAGLERRGYRPPRDRIRPSRWRLALILLRYGVM